MRLTLLLVCVGRSDARGALWLPYLGCEAPDDGTNGHKSSCWDPGGWLSHHQSNVQGLHQLKAGSLHHTHTHAPTHHYHSMRSHVVWAWGACMLLEGCWGVVGVCGSAVDPWCRHARAHDYPKHPPHQHTHQLQKGASMHVKNVCWANCPSAPRHSKCIIDPIALILVSFQLIVIVYLICEHMFSVT